MRITADHVRALLESELSEPNLVVLEGRVSVLDASDLGSQRYAGALVVASREDLHGRLGDREPSERELTELAAGLEAGVSNLGG
ncbi:hypothetical protein ACFS2C_24575 [Prauserella oleivorans]|uniref:Uncharacterized protein n=1 Tax=Prauserella oleivorans TaxID=1478153 RepID=A0ABW5WHF4_9PSEU